MNMNLLKTFGIFLIVLPSCGKQRPTASASLKEAPDFQNLRKQFGLKNALSWDEIEKTSQVKLTNIPWTDTYWPLASKETAARWENLNLTSDDEVGLATYLSTYAVESEKEEPSALLSPAEKYDLVFQLRHNKKPSQETLDDLIIELRDLDVTIHKTSDLPTKRELVRSILEKLEASEVFSGLTMTSHAWRDFLKYSGNSKFKYLNDNARDGEAWGWMGICHGWAPAAVMNQAPKHAVLAEIADKKILFTPGDIRGLLSRSWAQEAPADKEYFLGRRCNIDMSSAHGPIASNALGKGYAGSITTDGTKVGFTIIDSLLDLGVTVHGSKAAVFKIQPDDHAPPKFLLEVDKKYYFIVPSFADLVAYLKTSDTNLIQSVTAEISGCWDVNPASFHEVLIEQLGKHDTGFVMDRTRTGQVWNQPVYAATFKVSDLKRRDEIKDVAAAFRASGAVYVAEVSADVFWISEPSKPQLVYPGTFDKDHIEKTHYIYTLEFDESKKLIGGEWGTLDELDPVDNAPDFLFGYERDSEPTDRLRSTTENASIDYSGIVKKLLSCSLSDKVDGEKTVNDQTLPYKRCPIEQLQP